MRKGPGVDLERSEFDAGTGDPPDHWRAAPATRLPIFDRQLLLHLVVGIITTSALFFAIMLVTKH